MGAIIEITDNTKIASLKLQVQKNKVKAFFKEELLDNLEIYFTLH